jgi:uncharacterized protein YjbJ (UPF0337 family)
VGWHFVGADRNGQRPESGEFTLTHVFNRQQKGRRNMAGKIEKAKGRLKVALGSLTGNKDLESEGKMDRRAGQAKETIGRVKNKVDATSDKAERKAVETTDNARDAARRK